MNTRVSSSATLIASLAMVLAGCFQGEKPAPGSGEDKRSQSSATKKSTGHAMPSIPGEDVSRDIALENPIRSFEREDDDLYRHAPAIPSGNLRVFCHFEKNAKITLPARKAYSVADSGVTKDADPKELDYYKQFRNRKATNERSYGPAVGGAVVWAQRIEKGPAKIPEKLGFMTWCGGYRISGSKACIALAPDKIYIRNTDPFPVPIKVVHEKSGKIVFEADLPGFAGICKKGMNGEITAWNKHKEPGGSWHLGRYLNTAKMALSPILRQTGRYIVASKRHAFMKTSFFLTQNPYLARADSRGKFTLGGIPEGRHSFEVWHPSYEPVEKTLEIDIKKGVTTEIKIAFRVPDTKG